MAKVVPAHEVGLPEGAGRVRVSNSRARRGKILAVEHPIFGWLPYRQWALLRLIPEDRLVPAVIGGISTFWVLSVAMDAAGKIAQFVTDPAPSFLRALILPGGAIMEFLRLGLGPILPGAGVEQFQEEKFSDLWNKTPIPFYGALLVAAMILAGVDPGDVLIAITNLIPSL